MQISDKPTLIDFWAPWCTPCNKMTPVIDELKIFIGDKADIVKINVDESPEIAKQYNIKSIPTFIILKNKEETNRLFGSFSRIELIKNLIGEDNAS